MWEWLQQGLNAMQQAGAKCSQYQQFLDGLFQLSQADAVRAVRDKVASLDDADYQLFQNTIAGLIQQVAQNVDQLENSGWGDSYEDRMARMVAQIQGGGGAESPDLQRARYVLQSLREVQALSHQIRFSPDVRRQLEEQFPSAPPPPVPPTVPPPVPTAQTAASTEGFPAEGTADQQLAWLRQALEGEVRSGRIDPEREQALRSLMARLGNVMSEGEKADAALESGPSDLAARKADLQDSMQRVAEVRSLADEVRSMAKDVRTAVQHLAEGSRARRVVALLGELKDHVMTALNAPSGPRQSDREALTQFFAELARVTQQVCERGAADARLVKIERDSIRNLMYQLRQFERRGHLLLAAPVWRGWSGKPDVNLLSFAGRDETHDLLCLAADDIGLRVADPVQPGADAAAGRWEALQRAAIAVFDLSERAPDVYYQLGIAYALGTDVLLLCRAGVKVPFDVAQDVVSYDSGEDLRSRLPELLDRTLYDLQTRGQAGSQAATAAHCSRLAPPDMPYRDVLLGQLKDAAEDPVAFSAVLDQFLAQSGLPGLRVLRPRWPAFHPDSTQPRCFIVMPFDPRLKLTQAMRLAAEDRLRKAGVEPVRGDVAEGQEIIQSIWEETARATHVLVDLTEFNLNVCLELGIADAIGRPTHLIGVRGTEERLFRSIEKRRVNSYSERLLEDEDLAASLDRFIRRAGSAA